MFRFIVRRILIIPFALLAVNFLGFAFAHLALRFHQLQNPYGATDQGPPQVGKLYLTYLQKTLQGDFGQMPQAGLSVAEAVGKATIASLGLLIIAFTLSVGLGLLLGLRGIRSEKAEVAPWIAPLAAVGLAMPSFYIGTLFIFAGVSYILRGGEGAQSPLPLQGFGWDLHLVLPTLALMVRPMVQITQITAGLSAGEMGKQYIVAARGKGHSWQEVRWKHAFRNVLAPVVLTIAGSFRLLAGELVLVEYLFSWPGLGRLLAQTLIPPTVAMGSRLSGASILFLHPELVAAMLSIFTLWFLVADMVFSAIARQVDPRLQVHVEETSHV